MAGTLRELVTRFSFETDKKGINNFNKNMRGMRSNIRGIMSLFGVGLGAAGARSLFKMGQSAQRAEFSLKRLLGVKGTPLKSTLATIRKEMDAIRPGFGELIRPKEFNIAAAAFVETFGKGRRQIQMFREMFSFAAKESAITGDNVLKIFEGIQQGLTGGDFSALLGLPNFDKIRKQLLEFKLQIADPGEPGGKIALKNRMQALLKIMRESSAEQARSLREVPPPLVEADKAATQFKDTMDDLGKSVNEFLVPAILKLNTVLSRLDEFLSSISDKATKTQSSGVGGLFRNLLNFSLGGPGGGGLHDPSGLLGRERPKRRFTGKVLRDQTFSPEGAPSLTIHQTNVISGHDPIAIRNEVERVTKKIISDAAARIIPTEDR